MTTLGATPAPSGPETRTGLVNGVDEEELVLEEFIRLLEDAVNSEELLEELLLGELILDGAMDDRLDELELDCELERLLLMLEELPLLPPPPPPPQPLIDSDNIPRKTRKFLFMFGASAENKY